MKKINMINRRICRYSSSYIQVSKSTLIQAFGFIYVITTCGFCYCLTTMNQTLINLSADKSLMQQTITTICAEKTEVLHRLERVETAYNQLSVKQVPLAVVDKVAVVTSTGSNEITLYLIHAGLITLAVFVTLGGLYFGVSYLKASALHTFWTAPILYVKSWYATAVDFIFIRPDGPMILTQKYDFIDALGNKLHILTYSDKSTVLTVCPASGDVWVALSELIVLHNQGAVAYSRIAATAADVAQNDMAACCARMLAQI